MDTFVKPAVGTTIRLSDGRVLGYAEFGDPTGRPVIFCHGFGDSRLTRNPDDALTAALGVRLITLDGRGIGLSDFKHARSILDVVDDIALLADELQLDRFAVFGWSGGGPHALACAYAFPDRITAVGVACGFAPMDRPGATADMRKDMQRFIPLLRRMPWLAKVAMASLPGQYRKDPDKAFNKQFGHGLPEADTQMLARAEIRANVLAGAVEAVRSGSQGLALELQLLFARPWGFRPEDIQSEVQLWYGDADVLVPPQMGQYLAQAIGRSHLTIYPGEGHMLYVTHWAEILRSLTADA
jgi:pimeloyl-ACP methyl ester carboxylesterase